jgi:hypothetical protein
MQDFRFTLPFKHLGVAYIFNIDIFCMQNSGPRHAHSHALAPHQMHTLQKERIPQNILDQRWNALENIHKI